MSLNGLFILQKNPQMFGIEYVVIRITISTAHSFVKLVSFQCVFFFFLLVEVCSDV